MQFLFSQHFFFIAIDFTKNMTCMSSDLFAAGTVLKIAEWTCKLVQRISAAESVKTEGGEIVESFKHFSSMLFCKQIKSRLINI